MDFKPDFSFMLSESFYLQPTEQVAKELPGKVLVKKEGNIYLAGMIVETEAYLHKTDEASHSFKGKSKRNMPMFEKGGILYVYKSYGIHNCINVVTEKEEIGSAVLIRAVEPILGIEKMIEKRGVDNIKILCKGPGNIAKAFGFSVNENYHSLIHPELFIQKYKDFDDDSIEIRKRVGISRSIDLFLRFYLKKSQYISRK